MIKSFIKRAIQQRGLDLVPHHLSTDNRSALPRVAKLTEGVGTIIDVGASDGRWSRVTRQYFPGASVLSFEAQEVHRPALEEYCRSVQNTFMELSAASNKDGIIHFRQNHSLGGAASENAFDSDDVALPCATIDTAVKRNGLKGPFFIKLDTHGHEVEILEGARETLKQASLLQLETYTFANNRRLRFWEMCAHLENLGFLPAQVLEPMVRPADGLLWQMDLFFIPASHPAWNNTAWGGPEG